MERQKASHDPSTVFVSALSEFYSASKHGCNGDRANLNDVFQTIQDGELKLSSYAANRGKFQGKIKPCLRLMEECAAILDRMVLFSNMKAKPSEFVWGCLRYLFLSALKSKVYLEGVAEMFDIVGELCKGLCDPSQLKNLSLHQSSGVQHDIVPLYAPIIRCCGNAIGVMTRKREHLRGIVPGKFFKPFRIEYEANLADFRNVQRRVLWQINNSQEGMKAESATKKRRNDPQNSQSSSSFLFNTDRNILEQFALRHMQEENNGKVVDQKANIRHILESLQVLDYETDYHAALHACNFGLVSSIKKHSEYVNWSLATSGHIGCLWIHGAEEISRTGLAAAIVQDMQNNISIWNRTHAYPRALCYYFVLKGSPESELRVLQCFIAQLLRQTVNVPEAKRSFKAAQTLTSTGNYLIHFLRDLVRLFSRLHIVVCGLDKAADPDKVVCFLVKLYGSLFPLVKLLIVSGEDPKIKSNMVDVPVSEINLSSVNEEAKANRPANRSKPTALPRITVSPQSTKAQLNSVTLDERVHYQKTVLGMTDEQISRALPPGIYHVHGVGCISPSPSGEGDLAYAYRA